MGGKPSRQLNSATGEVIFGKQEVHSIISQASAWPCVRAAIELDWQAASTSAVHDGYLALWIDDTLRASLAGLDNDRQQVDSGTCVSCCTFVFV